MPLQDTATLMLPFKLAKQQNYISIDNEKTHVAWLLLLRFDTEEDMSFCRCMKCGEEGQDVVEMGQKSLEC